MMMRRDEWCEAMCQGHGALSTSPSPLKVFGLPLSFMHPFHIQLFPQLQQQLHRSAFPPNHLVCKWSSESSAKSKNHQRRFQRLKTAGMSSTFMGGAHFKPKPGSSNATTRQPRWLCSVDAMTMLTMAITVIMVLMRRAD